MKAQLLDGKKIAADLRRQLRSRVQERLAHHLPQPWLAVIMVGDNPASAVYVRKKVEACREVGFRSLRQTLSAETSQAELLERIAALNADPGVHGILVQLPLPPQIDAETVIEAIDPGKDVDGFHPYNIGRLALRFPALRPCTPKGIMTLLAATGVDLPGQEAVIVGVSNIVGRPVALELLMARCTVTSCHSRTRDLAGHVVRADVVIAAVGRPNFVRGDWIKPGAVVVDVGINRLPSGALAGDVEFEAAARRAAWITPVPGGVGPMTVLSLLENTLRAAEKADG